MINQRRLHFRIQDEKLSATANKKESKSQPVAASSVNQIKSDLECLTLDQFVASTVTNQDQPVTDKVKQIVRKESDDLRKTVSQNYQSDILATVFNRASDVSASTQETANKAALADVFSTG